jgi:hypothetical protein
MFGATDGQQCVVADLPPAGGMDDTFGTVEPGQRITHPKRASVRDDVGHLVAARCLAGERFEDRQRTVYELPRQG